MVPWGAANVYILLSKSCKKKLWAFFKMNIIPRTLLQKTDGVYLHWWNVKWWTPQLAKGMSILNPMCHINLLWNMSPRLNWKAHVVVSPFQDVIVREAHVKDWIPTHEMLWPVGSHGCSTSFVYLTGPGLATAVVLQICGFLRWIL